MQVANNSFTVYPGKVIFKASDYSGEEAFYKAHLLAATLAAKNKKEAWVVKNDSEVCGFGVIRDSIPTVLERINDKCLHSYWDYKKKSWWPLHDVETEAVTMIEATV